MDYKFIKDWCFWAVDALKGLALAVSGERSLRKQLDEYNLTPKEIAMLEAKNAKYRRLISMQRANLNDANYRIISLQEQRAYDRKFRTAILARQNETLKHQSAKIEGLEGKVESISNENRQLRNRLRIEPVLGITTTARELVHASPLAMVYVDLSGGPVEMNDDMLNRLGYSNEEAISKGYHQIIRTPTILERAIKEHEKDETFCVKLGFLKAKGLKLDIECEVVPLYDKQHLFGGVEKPIGAVIMPQTKLHKGTESLISFYTNRRIKKTGGADTSPESIPQES